MRIRIYLVLLCICLISGMLSAQTTQIISDVVAQINQDSVTNYIQTMQNFGSRFEYKENRKDVANWLKNEYIKMGYQQVELDSFMCETSYGLFGSVMQYNVVATLPGTERPDEIYIIGGHYDSFNNHSDPKESAPGADDNASGTTGALETARAIMKVGYQPEATIKFVGFAAEELMLFGYSGSEYMAKSYREKGIDIKLMINHDMIANNYDAIDESRIHVNYYTGNEYLKNIAINMMNDYSRVTGVEGGRDIWTDSRSFHEEGFPAIYYDEYSFSPHYHSSDDVIENYDMEYCTEVIKGGAAMLIYSIEAPSIVANFRTQDVGDGHSIKLIWAHNTDGIERYDIYVAKVGNEFQFNSSTSDSTITISGLEEDVNYLFGIKAVDSGGDESYMQQVSAVPHSLPLAPASVNANAKWESIELNWNRNHELDFLTYKIVKIPQLLADWFPNMTFFTNDTTFIDTDVMSGVWYEYTVQALDADSNVSINNISVQSRAVSLDKGVVFVNETSNGDGSIGNPSFDQIENFYYSLPNNNFEMYDVNIEEEENFSLANIGAHQTVVWHIDKSSDVNTYQYLDIIKEYLDYGGNLLFTGYKPSKAFTYSTSMITDYSEGDFLFDYIDVTQSENSILALFKSGQSESTGYPNLELDLNKISTAAEHIKTVEVMHPTNSENVIYSYVTDYDPTTAKGILSGKPIGVEHLSEDYNAIMLSVPLYYIKQEKASAFLNFVLTNKFDTPTDIEEDENKDEVVNSFQLFQNYPNPFNPTTKIKFSIPNVGRSGTSPYNTKIIVYDALGREVNTLLNKSFSPGKYEVEFDGSNLSSGIYFYRLTSGSFVQTRKMLIIK